ncbi:MAG: hypothetical protein R3C28_13115 [Pirellulaceae bacterium]
MVSTSPVGPVPRVIDFGIAKALYEPNSNRLALTHSLQLLAGTPAPYMSPEQSRSDRVERRHSIRDVYSLGGLVRAEVTGSAPIPEEALNANAISELQRIIRDVEPLRPSSRLRGSTDRQSMLCERRPESHAAIRVDGDLDWIVMKALAKDPALRYDSVDGFARDLESFLAGDPVAAGPPTTSYRIRKIVQKHRATAVVMVLATLAVCVSLVLVSLVAWKYREQRREQAQHLVALQRETTRATLARRAKRHDDSSMPN